jgi:hypothetical protein
LTAVHKETGIKEISVRLETLDGAFEFTFESEIALGVALVACELDEVASSELCTETSVRPSCCFDLGKNKTRLGMIFLTDARARDSSN